MVKYILLLVALIALSFCLRLFPLTYSHWWDETVYLQHAEIMAGFKSDNYDEFLLRPPLLSALFALGFLAWHHVYAANVIVASLGALGVFYAYLVGKRLYSEKVGFLAAIFVGLSPYIVQNSGTFMTDVPSLTFISAFFYHFLCHYEKGGTRDGLLAGFFFSMSVLMKFTSLIIIFVVPVFIILHGKNAGSIKLLALSSIVFLSPYLLWSQTTYGSFFTPFIKANTAISDFNNPWFFYLSEFGILFPTIVMLGLLLSVAALAIQRGSIPKWQTDVFLIAWIFMYIAYLSVTPHKELRYLIPAALPVVILSGRGYSNVMNAGKVQKYVILLILIVLGFSSFQPVFPRLYSPLINTYETEELIVSHYLNENATFNTGHVLYANKNYPVFAYYTNYTIRRLYETGDDFYSGYPENMKEPGILLVYKNYLQPTQSWVEDRAEFTKIREFDNIILYQYRTQAENSNLTVF
jgi:4-amino-4-deoxy-L-arabinose transferase-like glycosyltransferase